ncbi:hypothetical protein BMF94_1989 [Rhodotorula taiwanensis]|uniref:F-box domain-containing protein n=1 Tax=Rhodotorula taiwanensis TaxID=741276 RepID=A0A2S5BE35_9BASI|nr:hypothetical protein BMF94_1989 [Rhodotorula taiwanensis]
MPAFRLPFELELHILELATPPRVSKSVHRRVYGLRQIALVHRSFTKWAHVKLHEQFLFTFRGRAGEQERLQERLTAGFGSPSLRMLSRLYLDTRAWCEDAKWKLDRFDDPYNSSSESQSHARPTEHAADQDDDALSGPWSPYDVLRPWLPAVKSVWLFTPYSLEAAGPFPLCTGTEYLEIDEHAWGDEHWPDLCLAAPANLTSLVLRSVDLQDSVPSLPNLRTLVLIRSSFWLDYPEVPTALLSIDVFESIASDLACHPNDLAFFQPFARTARFYQTTCPDPAKLGYCHGASPPTAPSRLETCTFTWLTAAPVPASSPDPLATLR